MKKLLLASAAIVATAGVAAAQNVNVTGDARFGILYNSAAATTMGMSHRVRLVFTAERETNAGVKVGVWTRLDVQNSGLVSDGSRVYVSANGLTLTVGSADGAVASRVALYGGGLGFTSGIGRVATHAGYAEEGGMNVVRADYTNSGFTVSASYALGTITTANVAGLGGVGFTAASGEVGVSYSASGITVGAGIHEGGNWSVSAGYAQGAYAVGALVSKAGANTNYRLHGTYTMGDITLGATYTRVGATDNYGLGVNYALGGGASIRAAIGSHNSVTVGQLGMNFSF